MFFFVDLVVPFANSQFNCITYIKCALSTVMQSMINKLCSLMKLHLPCFYDLDFNSLPMAIMPLNGNAPI